MAKEIKEIQIKEVSKLSEEAKKEVFEKLNKLPDTFDFRGFAKVSYAETSPLAVVNVEPIEGDIINELQRLGELIKK